MSKWVLRELARGAPAPPHLGREQRSAAGPEGGPAKPSQRLRSLLNCNLRCQPSIIKKCFEFKQCKALPFLGGGWPHLKLGVKPRLWSQETSMKLSSPSLCITSMIASELPSSLRGSRPSGFSCSKILLLDCMKAPDPFQRKVKQVNAAKELKIQAFVWLCQSCLSQLTLLLVSQGNWVYVQIGTRNWDKLR